MAVSKVKCAVFASFLAVLLISSNFVMGAPLLLGNQMTALSVIPKTEEQAKSLLDFLRDNPQYGNNSTDEFQVNGEEVIFVPNEDVTKVSSGLQDIGLRLDDSNSTYQIS